MAIIDKKQKKHDVPKTGTKVSTKVSEPHYYHRKATFQSQNLVYFLNIGQNRFCTVVIKCKRAMLQGEAVNLPINLRFYPHLW